MPPRIGPRRAIHLYLALWREKAGLTQEHLGGRIFPQVDKGTVSRWESAAPGRLSTGVIAAYAEALGLHPQDMYRPPAAGPSLDAMVDKMDPDLREQAINVILALYGRQRH